MGFVQNGLIGRFDLNINAPMHKTIRITPERTSWAQIAHDFAKFRGLLFILAWREISIRYKQTILGLIWVLLQPLTSALLFAYILGRLGRLPSDNVPYLLFGFFGLVLWNMFSQGLDRASSSIVLDERLISKVYFPRWIIPLAAVLSTLPDFLINLVFGFLLLLVFGVHPSWQIIFVPPTVLFVGMLTSSVGLVLAALTVRYRDFRFIIPFLLQVGLFASPVLYSASLVPPAQRALFYLNPLAGPLAIFRHGLVEAAPPPDWASCGISFLTGTFLIVLCAYLFRWMEDGLADVI
jgi:lipopolysaccharide transport system permease protein